MRTYLLEKSRVVFQVGKMRTLSANAATNGQSFSFAGFIQKT